ncbi:MAG: helix-turn-helix domain-containing protein [Clostridium sp.]|nr:helix-turn-helix domain-containing protein [Clostridium sp.]MCM1444161.1 helix-turn-helix domain-containing protein [Candidatus Amulumruptor caecigallinarius]
MIGKILKTIRKSRGLTQEELSNITGIPQNTISQYENEKFEPSYNTVYTISKACGFEIEFINKSVTLTAENINRKEL